MLVWRFEMNIQKGLLLGTAASFVAVAAPQAAHLPVKGQAGRAREGL
jgi:hypothetical protein